MVCTNSAEKGYADYVLYEENGKPLAVIEAKRSSKDPKIGQQQAKLYAEVDVLTRHNWVKIYYF